MLDITVLHNTLYWSYADNQISKSFRHPIRQFLQLSDGSGIVVVLEAPHIGEKNEAFIVDATGAICKKIVIPQEVGAYEFIYDVYYVRNELAFILVSHHSDYDIACHFDEYGNFIRSHLSK